MALLFSALVHFCEKCWSRPITLIVWPWKGSSLSMGKVWHCELLPAWYLSPYSHTSLLSSILVDFPLGGLIKVGGKRATGVVFKAVLNFGLVLILLLLFFGQQVQSTSLGWLLSSSTCLQPSRVSPVIQDTCTQSLSVHGTEARRNSQSFSLSFEWNWAELGMPPLGSSLYLPRAHHVPGTMLVRPSRPHGLWMADQAAGQHVGFVGQCKCE